MDPINPTNKNDCIVKDERFTCLYMGKTLHNYYLAYVPINCFDQVPMFGACSVETCYNENFFESAERDLGILLLFKELCNCASIAFYIPTIMFQFLTERKTVEKMWQSYYTILNNREPSKIIGLHNWKTETILYIEFIHPEKFDKVMVYLSYKNNRNKKSESMPGFITDALAFLDYCSFFYNRFVSDVLETNNYVLDVSLPVNYDSS